MERVSNDRWPNLTHTDAMAAALAPHNRLYVHQPGSGVEEPDQSMEFAVLPTQVSGLIEDLEEEEEDPEPRGSGYNVDQWRKGVAIGVGVGVPFAVVLTTIIACRVAHWHDKEDVKDGLCLLCCGVCDWGVYPAERRARRGN